MLDLTDETQVLLETASNIAKDIASLEKIKLYSGDPRHERKVSNLILRLEKEMDEVLSLIGDWGVKHNEELTDEF